MDQEGRTGRTLTPRAVTPLVVAMLAESRAVALLGPRQVGKTTLARDLLGDDYRARYLTLDDAPTLRVALEDPVGFIAGLEVPVVIDEIQRAPELMLAIKVRLDRDQRSGQFLITGSADILTLPSVRDALPGRVEYVYLWPFSQSEARGRTSDLVDTLFEGAPVTLYDMPLGRGAYASMIASGGYPSAYRRTVGGRRRFFEAYVDAVVGRDVTDIAHLRDAASVGSLLHVVAARSASLLSRESIARDLGVDRKTIDLHLSVLEGLFLVRRSPAWHTNLSQREIKTPKIYVTDTGLITSLLGIDPRRLAADPDVAGPLFETFVVMELVRLNSSSDDPPRVYHYRDRDQREVDVVLERADGDVVAIEVKSGASVDRGDFRALRYLRDRTGSRFRAGVVLYSGSNTLPFGDRLWAIPLSALWGGDVDAVDARNDLA